MTFQRYKVQLYGKIDTGGSICREGIDVCQATGYHDSGNWSSRVHRGGSGHHGDASGGMYYPGDLLHSWAASASENKINQLIVLPEYALEGVGVCVCVCGGGAPYPL